MACETCGARHPDECDCRRCEKCQRWGRWVDEIVGRACESDVRYVETIGGDLCDAYLCERCETRALDAGIAK